MEKFVAIGIDGVLADFEGFLVEYLESAHPKYAHANRDVYDLLTRGYPDEVWLDAQRFVADPNAYYGVSAIQDGFRFLSEIDDSDFEVLILTSRPADAKAFTRRWLKREISGWMSFEDLLGVRFTPSKAALLFQERENLAFLIDDNPEEVLEAQKLGMTAYSWAQPWNEHIFPKVFSTRDGHTMYQENEYTDPVYFWGEERK